MCLSKRGHNDMIAPFKLVIHLDVWSMTKAKRSGWQVVIPMTSRIQTEIPFHSVDEMSDSLHHIAKLENKFATNGKTDAKERNM